MTSFAELAADAVNPAYLGVFLATVAARSPSRVLAMQFFKRSAMAIGVTYVLAHFKQWTGVWPSSGDFPSGHMAFFCSVATCFAVFDRRSLAPGIVLGAIYAWLIVRLGYHVPADIAGGVILAVPVTLLCFRGWKRLRLDQRNA